MAMDTRYENGQGEAAARAAGVFGPANTAHRLDGAITREGLEGRVAQGIIEANKEALSQATEHPVFAEGRAYVRKIENGISVQVKGAPRFPSGFRRYGE
jgi:hypothetical protein